MTFAQRRNRLTTHFSERIPVVKRHISVVGYTIWVCVSTLYDIRTTTHFSERIPVVKRRISVHKIVSQIWSCGNSFVYDLVNIRY